MSNLRSLQWQCVPEKALTVSGADRRPCRGGTCPTTRDIYESIVHGLALSGGIVKHSGLAACRRYLFKQLARLTRSTTKLRDRIAGTLRTFTRHAIRQSPYCHRQITVTRPIPNRQQIACHGVRSGRAETRSTCLASSQCSQPSASSIRLIAGGDGGGSRIGSGCRPTRSTNSTTRDGKARIFTLDPTILSAQ